MGRRGSKDEDAMPQPAPAPLSLDSIELDSLPDAQLARLYERLTEQVGVSGILRTGTYVQTMMAWVQNDRSVWLVFDCCVVSALPFEVLSLG